MDLARELLCHCIGGIAVSRHKLLAPNDPYSTVENLERDSHVILGSNPHDTEINKNLYNSDELFVDYHIATILFTTQPFEDLLLISKKNFAAYFGPVFSTHAMLSVTNDINPNFSGWDMIKNNIFGAGGPYYNQYYFQRGLIKVR
nr:13629_t:CDS:2 [Entrophospora candida]